MSEKTKNIDWLPWAVSFSVVMAIALVITYFNWDGYFTPPWVVANGVSDIIAVESFKTSIFEEQVFSGKVLQAFLGLVFLFVVGPSLWIFSEIRNESRDEEDELNKGTLWYVGTPIIIFGLITAVVGTAVNGFIFQNIWEQAEVNKNEDKIRTQLVKLGFDAYQLYYLPAEMGGGDGSFQVTTENGTMRPIKLDDLEHYNDSLANSYVLKSPDSTGTLTIYGIGNQESRDPNLKNMNDDMGRGQLSVDVFPGDKIKILDMN